MNPCHVADSFCLAPAGIRVGTGVAVGTKSARGRCYNCGLPVCRNCSLVRRRRQNGPIARTIRARVCHDCVDAEELAEDLAASRPLRPLEMRAAYLHLLELSKEGER